MKTNLAYQGYTDEDGDRWLMYVTPEGCRVRTRIEAATGIEHVVLSARVSRSDADELRRPLRGSVQGKHYDQGFRLRR